MKENETVYYYCALFALLNEITLELEKVIYDVPYLTEIFNGNDMKLLEKKRRNYYNTKNELNLNIYFILRLNKMTLLCTSLP